MYVIIWIMFYSAHIVLGVHPQKTSAELLDSLVMQVEKDKQTDRIETVRRDQRRGDSNSGSVTTSWFGINSGTFRQNQNVSPTGPKELTEADCPDVHCFTFRNQTSKQVQLECTSDPFLLTYFTVIDRIHCRYWKNPTTSTGMPGAGLDLNGPSKNEGRGFDLKIILSPNTENKNENSERRLQVNELIPGLLGRVIKTLRASLHMQQSPVHLTLSFIYINKLRRIDLGDLSTQFHVTRLSLWNPFEWDEDSLIPERTAFDEKNYIQSPLRAQVPPYFRLTVFCDHANRNPSFRRIWLPWKSWQVRFNHCHNFYVCRTWLSKYPICDNPESDSSSRHMFMPSSFLMPKVLKLDTTTLDTVLRKPTAQAWNIADNQILYENQCQIEPSLFDPLDDLKLDHERSCWQPGAYQPHRIGDTLEFLLPDTNQLVYNGNREHTNSMELNGSSIMTNIPITTMSAPTTTTIPNTSSISEKALLVTEMLTSSPNVVQHRIPITTTNTQSIDEGHAKNTSPSMFVDEINLENVQRNPQSSDVNKEISQSYLTTAVIILSVLVIFLLLSLIFLILWIRSRQRGQRTKWKPGRQNGFLPYSETANKHNNYLEQGNATQQSLIETTPKVIGRYVAPAASPRANQTEYDCPMKINDNALLVYGPTRVEKRDKIILNGSQSSVFGVSGYSTNVLRDSGNNRPPPTPKHKSASKRIRRASHPSESPSLQRKQSSSVHLDNRDNEDSIHGRKRTPSQEGCKKRVDSSQISLQSRSQTRLDRSSKNSSRSGLTDLSPKFDACFSNFTTVCLRPDENQSSKGKIRKYSPIRQPKKQHTLVFENGELDETQLPFGLRQSLQKL